MEKRKVFSVAELKTYSRLFNFENLLKTGFSEKTEKSAFFRKNFVSFQRIFKDAKLKNLSKISFDFKGKERFPYFKLFYCYYYLFIIKLYYTILIDQER